MDKERIIKKAFRSLTEKREIVTIPYVQLSFLQKIGLAPCKRTFVVKPVTAGTLGRISELLLNIDIDTVSDNNYKDALNVMSKNITDVIELCAIVFHGSSTEPPQELIHFLTRNAQVQVLVLTMFKVWLSLDLKSFITSITLIKGVSLNTQGS